MKRLLFLIYFVLFSTCLLIFAEAWAFSPLRIEVKGISGKPLSNVSARLEVVKESYGNNWNQDIQQNFIKHAPDNIRQALEPYGYFKAKINSKQVNHTLFFYIDPGPALRISKVNLSIIGLGQYDPEIQKFQRQFPLAAGQVFLADEYENAKDQLFEIANNQGYLKATFDKKEIRINLQNYTAEIDLIFNTGLRYYFGQVVFSPSPFSPRFLKRFATFKPNEPFSSKKLMKFQQDLRDSNYFQLVNAIPDFNHTNDPSVPVNVAVTAKKSQRYDIGIGYGTFTGPRLTLGADFRRITDTGQHFNTQLKLSSVLSGLAGKYYIPGKNPLTDLYTIGGNVQYFSPKNGSSFSQTISGSYVKTLTDWQNSISINYLNERYKVTGEPKHISQVLYPNLTLSRVKADNLISPTFGTLFNFTVQVASDELFSKTDFFQSEVKGKWIFSPTNASRIILRGDLGYTVVEDLNQLPLSLRYFAGGLSSVRGYPTSSIGPGKYLEVASAEYQHQIIGDWSGAIFYDIGNASNTFNGVFNRGQGLGLIYKSMLGPIQVYVGQALSKKNKPLSVEFSIGPDF